MTEEWKDIKDYPNYQVSNFGNVKNIKTNKVLKFSVPHNQYYKVVLSKNSKSKQFFVHRLVAKAFIPNLENKPFVNHIDCNRKNNYYKNLEWCTQKENINYAQKINSSFNNRNKKVAQYDKQNNLIKIYNSISEASRKTGVHIATISYNANKKNKSRGDFIWRFAK